MSLSDELQRLADMKSAGLLTDTEFQQAKAKLLNEDTRPPAPVLPPGDQSIGQAANRYVSFRIITAAIGLLIFLLFILPTMCSLGNRGIRAPFP